MTGICCNRCFKSECSCSPEPTPNTILEALAEENPEALLFDGLEGAPTGFARQQYKPPLAVYDREKCLEILRTRDGMTHEEAEEFFSFNTEGAWVGEGTPLILTKDGR